MEGPGQEHRRRCPAHAGSPEEVQDNPPDGRRVQRWSGCGRAEHGLSRSDRVRVQAGGVRQLGTAADVDRGRAPGSGWALVRPDASVRRGHGEGIPSLPAGLQQGPGSTRYQVTRTPRKEVTRQSPATIMVSGLAFFIA